MLELTQEEKEKVEKIMYQIWDFECLMRILRDSIEDYGEFQKNSDKVSLVKAMIKVVKDLRSDYEDLRYDLIGIR